MLKAIREIVDEYSKYGIVENLHYRGKMKYYPETIYSDDLHHLSDFESEYHPAWTFTLIHNSDGLKYRYVIIKILEKGDESWDAEFCVIPGKHFCTKETVFLYDDLWDDEVKSSIKWAEEANHFTMNPKIKIVG